MTHDEFQALQKRVTKAEQLQRRITDLKHGEDDMAFAIKLAEDGHGTASVVEPRYHLLVSSEAKLQIARLMLADLTAQREAAERDLAAL